MHIKYIYKQYISSDAWCWIGFRDSFIVNMLIYYIPLVAMLCFISFLYIATIIHLTKKLQTSTLLYNAASVRHNPNTTQSVYDNYNRYKTLQRELTVYLIAIILCRIWGVVASIETLIPHNHEIPAIILLYSFFAPLQGFVNTFLFFNSSIRKRVRQSKLCSKWSLFSMKNNNSEYQPLIESKETTPTSANHLIIEPNGNDNNNNNNNNNHHTAFDLDYNVTSRSSLPSQIGRNDKDRKMRYHHPHGHSSNNLSALISPPFHGIETSWPYPEAPDLNKISSTGDACHSLPNVGLTANDMMAEHDRIFNKYTSLNDDKNNKNNNKQNKKNSFVDKLVKRLSITKRHNNDTTQSLNAHIGHHHHHHTKISNKPFSAGNVTNKNNHQHFKNNKILDDQFAIYKDRFERSDNDHATSSQYLPESLNTDWDNNNPLKPSSTNFKFEISSPTRKDRKKRVIELEESKFEKEIIEEYSVFITTFNMVCFFIF